MFSYTFTKVVSKYFSAKSLLTWHLNIPPIPPSSHLILSTPQLSWKEWMWGKVNEIAQSNKSEVNMFLLGSEPWPWCFLPTPPLELICIFTLYEVWGNSSQCQRCYSVVFGTVTALTNNSNVCEHRGFALPSRMQKSPKNSLSSLSEVTPYDNIQERVYWAIAICYIRSQLVAYLQYVLPEAPRKELKVVESV